MKLHTELWDKLYGFQKEGIEFLLKNRTALLADEVGVGKTAQFLMAAQSTQAKSILILCPASIKYDYPFRCNQWDVKGHKVFIITPQNASRHSQINEGIFVINYDICFRKEVARVFARKRYDILIADESHYLKNQKSQRSKACFGSGGYISLSRRVWFVTGTPMLNRPEELFTTLNGLCPERIAPFNDYISFTIKYCGGHKGPWGWVADGATNREDLSKRLAGFMLRRELDVLPEIPEKILRVIHLEKTPEIEEGLFQEERELKESPFISAGHVSEIQMSIRQKMGLAKLSEVSRYIKEQTEADSRKLVIFAYHIALIEALDKEFVPWGVLNITGKDSAISKKAKIDKFKTDGYQILICQIDAIGTGVDGLQEVCRHAIFAEISYVPGINQQAMGRLHRNGQKHKTIFDFLTVEGSIDENILDKNILKAGNIQSIMQDQRHIFDFTQPKNSKGINTMFGNRGRINIKFESEFDPAQLEQLVSTIAAGPSVSDIVVSVEFDGMSSTEKKPTVTPTLVEPKAETRGRKKKAETLPAEPSVLESAAVLPPEVTSAPAPSAIADDPFAAAEAPAPVAAPSHLTVNYDQFIKQTAATIQAKVGAHDPAKINSVLGELNAEIKKAYPQYSHVLKISDPSDQFGVVKLINKFLKAKGL